MASTTKIEWSEATWNPITGCTRVSKGCQNCYAERLAHGRLRHHPSRKGLTDANGRWTGEVRFNEQWIDQPLRWRKPRMIFVVAHGDLFHPNVPDEWIDKVFAVMAIAPQHTYQVLTKRPQRMRDYILSASGRVRDMVSDRFDRYWSIEFRRRALYARIRSAHDRILAGGWPLANAWMGTSVEDQRTADERIPHLLDTPAAVRWISAEPLLEGLDLTKWMEASDNPVHESGRNGRGSLQRGSKRSASGETRWFGVAHRSTPKESMGWKSDHQKGCAPPDRRDAFKGIQDCQDDGRLEADNNASASIGVEGAERTDTGWPHDQPQERRQGRQQAGQLGAGDIFGEPDSRESCSEDGEMRKPIRSTQSRSEAQRGSGNRDSEATSERRAAGFDSSRLRSGISDDLENRSRRAAISWLIAGGESGPGYRPMDPAWARSLRDQCKASGVRFFMKQMAGKKEIPADLMVREYPNG